MRYFTNLSGCVLTVSLIYNTPLPNKPTCMVL